MRAPSCDVSHILTVLAGLIIYQLYVGAQEIDDNCRLQESTVPITKRIHSSEHGTTLTCSGDIRLNKCEGVCESSVAPSVRYSSGFVRNCTCCREATGGIIERQVTLTSCQNSQGDFLEGHSEVITIKDMLRCKCQACND